MSKANIRPRWAPRVSRFKIARLYHRDAKGMRDEGLVDEVGVALLVRIQSILVATDAHRGRAKCFGCGGTIVGPPRSRRHGRRGQTDELEASCADCGWRLPWEAYHRSYRKKQLLAGGMEPFFREFQEQYPRVGSYGDKMVLIDTLIHRYHWELQNQAGRPGAANLIGGTSSEVIAFLNELTYGPKSTPGLEDRREAWRRTLNWAGWTGDNVHEQAAEYRWEGQDRMGE